MSINTEICLYMALLAALAIFCAAWLRLIYRKPAECTGVAAHLNRSLPIKLLVGAGLLANGGGFIYFACFLLAHY